MGQGRALMGWCGPEREEGDGEEGRPTGCDKWGPGNGDPVEGPMREERL